VERDLFTNILKEVYPYYGIYFLLATLKYVYLKRYN
jgi:hypothetical protein